MADSTTPVPQLASGQSQKEVTANANFDMSSPAMLYGRNHLTTSGLTWGYLGGRWDSASIASGTVALTDNATNYVVALISSGAVSVSTATTNWNATTSYLRLYKVTTVSGAVTAYEDHRSALGLPPTVTTFTGGTLTSALNEAPITTLASASTTDIGAEAANTISVTGTTTITALGTIASGALRRVIFTGALTLTHNGTSLILPTAANITTATGDVAEFVSLGSGNWRCTNYERADGTSLAGSPFSGGTLSSALNEAPIATIASASTVNIGAAAANTISITGTTTITAFDTIAGGALRRLIFAGVLTLTHNGSSLILPTGSNITTNAGDVAEFVSLGSGNWRCTNYQRADVAARELQLSCSDLTTALATGTSKAYVRAPRAMTVTGVRASLLTAQASGSTFTVDINDSGTSILSTKLTIDNTEKTSATAAAAAVISDSAIADDAEITVDIDQIGDGTAKGLIVTIFYV